MLRPQGSQLSLRRWLRRLLFNVFDVLLIGEWMDFLFTLTKINARKLRPDEITEARKVLGDALDYAQVRVDEYAFLAFCGKWYARSHNMGLTTWHTVNFTRKLRTAPGNGDMAWLVHELAHVAQYEAVGTRYMGEALHAQTYGGYAYGGRDGLTGKDLVDFNREQQASILEDAYRELAQGCQLTIEQEHMILQAKRREF